MVRIEEWRLERDRIVLHLDQLQPLHQVPDPDFLTVERIITVSRRAGARPNAARVQLRATFVASIALLALLAWPADSQAQIRGRVTDSAGQPAADARVELWTPVERVAVARTGASGDFAFAAVESASGVVVSRPGFVTQTVAVRAPAESMVVRLAPAQARLDTLVVRGSPTRICPNRDQPEARALWTAAAGRYSQPDSLYIGSSSMRMLNEVAWRDVGAVDEGRLRSSGRETGPQRRTVQPEHGYGMRVSQSWSPEFAGWEYTAIGSHFAQHLTDASFGTYNSLSVVERAADETTLAFCSRGLGRQAVGIEGTLTIGADSTIHFATWRFRPPRPQEEAGGEATFVPHPGGGRRPWLVPASSLFWRRLAGSEDRFVQLWEEFNAWSISRRIP